MKILFFTESNWCIPAISQIKYTDEIIGVVTNKEGSKSNKFLIEFLVKEELNILDWENSKLDKIQELVKEQEIELGICFGFSFKIPEEIYSIFKFGIVNVHFGKLPKYAGPAPLFWTLKNQEKFLTISIHQIDRNWDAGNLLVEEELPIYPGEPFGLLASRASLVTVEKLQKLISTFSTVKQIPLELNNSPLKRPSDSDLTIDWKNQKANEIESLINASNPSYGGAISYFRGSPIRILEVSPADVNIPGIFSPGSIVYADPNQGVFVICGDYNFLRINILQLESTIISGQKLAALGVKVYEKFE